MKVMAGNLAVIAAVVLVVSGIAPAQPAGMEPGMHQGRQMMMQQAGEQTELSVEVRMKVLDEQVGFLRSTSQLRTDLAVKRLELQKLWLADEPDYDKIAAKNRELTELRMKMSQKRFDLQLALRKLMPEGRHGMGRMGMGMMGGGMMGGMGCGMMGGMGQGMMGGGMMGGMGCPGGGCGR